jgi:hypothetical protein
MIHLCDSNIVAEILIGVYVGSRVIVGCWQD